MPDEDFSSSPSASHTLLPCPFCGGEAELGDAEECGPGAYVVCCTRCLSSSMVSFASKDDPSRKLIEAWNRRTSTDLLEVVRFCLKFDGGECLGDHPKMLAKARAAVAAYTQAEAAGIKGE